MDLKNLPFIKTMFNTDAPPPKPLNAMAAVKLIDEYLAENNFRAAATETVSLLKNKEPSVQLERRMAAKMIPILNGMIEQGNKVPTIVQHALYIWDEYSELRTEFAEKLFPNILAHNQSSNDEHKVYYDFLIQNFMDLHQNEEKFANIHDLPKPEVVDMKLIALGKFHEVKAAVGLDVNSDRQPSS